MLTKHLWWCGLVCLLCVVGCKKQPPSLGVGAGAMKLRAVKSGVKPYVVTTTGMLADAVKRVGGTYVVVEGLMGPSVDPHLYKATASDTQKLSKADLVIYNGLHLEGKMQDILQKMARFRSVVAATDQIAETRLLKPSGFQGFHDPHVWFDVSLWQEVVKRIADALSQVDPTHQSVYRANAAAYDRKLMALHHWTKRALEQIPAASRVLVTSHDAFGYFGQAYGLQVVGLQGISTVAEAGIKDVERVIKLLVEKKIPAIFSETSVSEQMIKAVIQGCTARQHKVEIGGKLFSDAMGAAGTQEGTYTGMVQHNVKTVVKALAGKAPAAFVYDATRAAPALRRMPAARRAPAPRLPVERRSAVRGR